MPGKGFSLAIIALAQVLALSVWFAGAAALPALQAEAGLSGAASAALSSAVQIGFVIGALTSAAFALPDRFDARRVFAAGALIAALASLAAITAEPGSVAMIAARSIAGAGLALVYPVGMKLAASWADGDAGLLVGLLVGALTLGSAAPHLAAPLLETLSWRAPFLLSAGAALAASILIFASRAGPAFTRAPAFRPGAAFAALKRKDLALINLGYLGHMWELYAMWAWTGTFIAAWRASRGLETGAETGLFTFAIVAVGAAGALGAGWIADRAGRAVTAGTALAIGGMCALATPVAWAGPGWLLGAVLLVYGITVIADSAQFSAALAERAPKDLAGSLLTLQTATGFALTAVSVHLAPLWAETIGWRFVFVPLVIGPVIGVTAMAAYRRMEMRGA
ncbi:MAG: MFS transporter [Alphaproteobacteria bacterium]|nr:MFS transporter [Alphaproteobacteria bacterium]